MGEQISAQTRQFEKYYLYSENRFIPGGYHFRPLARNYPPLPTDFNPHHGYCSPRLQRAGFISRERLGRFGSLLDRSKGLVEAHLAKLSVCHGEFLLLCYRECKLTSNTNGTTGHISPTTPRTEERITGFERYWQGVRGSSIGTSSPLCIVVESN